MSGAERETTTSATPTELSVASGVPSIQELVQAIHRSTELAASAAVEAAGAAERAAGIAEEAAATVAQLRDHPRRPQENRPQDNRAVERRSPSRPFHWVATLTHMLDDARSARSQAQADHAAIMELRSERDRWQMDSLTGVLARSAGEDRARIELDRARRLHTDLVCVFLDVSGLKATNDTYGHGAGDVALQAVAALLLGSVRAYDTVFRYGGDEFVCIVSEAAEESMRRRFVEITERPLRFGKGAVGLSFGMSGLREGDDLGTLLDRADADMYARRRQTALPHRGDLPATG
jgi:diguanylate cyclase (GGDEF)-like protein